MVRNSEEGRHWGSGRRTAVQGRFLPFAAFWAGSPHGTIMLQCDRRESANSGRSDCLKTCL